MTLLQMLFQSILTDILEGKKVWHSYLHFADREKDIK